MTNTLNEPKFTKAAEQVARKLKAERLARLPGMDKVAVALNSVPTYDEHMAAKHFMRALVDLGYEILDKKE